MLLSVDLQHPIYLEALTHSSYIKEHPQAGQHNEVLEFIGDAVLQLCMTNLLVQLYPDFREGDLTRMRHLLVDTKTLAAIAREVNLGRHLRLGVGESKDGGRDKDKMLANTVEALLGARYRLEGLDGCQRVVDYYFHSRALAIRDYVPPKQKLMEWCQKKYKTTPEYKVVEQSGADHERRYTVAVWIEGEELARGQGSSKKEGTNAAAVAAVKRLCQEGAMSSDIG